MLLDDPAALAEKIVLGLTAVASGVALLRQHKDESNTSNAVETAKQASVDAYINQLRSLEEELARTRERADDESQAARDRERELRGINDSVREMFERAIGEFRDRLDRQEREARARADAHQNRIADLVEEIALVNAREEGCRLSMTVLEGTINELKDSKQLMLRRIHDMANRLFAAEGLLKRNGLQMPPRGEDDGFSTATDIIGDRPK